jgi:acetyl-CoA carboxylase biotin carboxyl carrier protein
MTEPHQPEIGDALAELREHTKSLAQDLAGPLRRVSVQSGDVTIEVEWQPQSAPAQAAAAQSPPRSVSEPVDALSADATPADEAADGYIVISSPMVGTVFRAPSPDDAPFIEIGDTVELGQTVAIVEAMKLFNPITADVPGVVAEVLVVDGQPVQFGQPLVRLKADSAAALDGDADREG